MARDNGHIDCYGFAVTVYREGLGLEIPDIAAASSPVAVARWFKAQQDSWVELDSPEAYCIVAMGHGKHITHVGVYHPDGLVFHVSLAGVIGQPIDMLKGTGYNYIRYFQHRSLIKDEYR